MVSDEEEEEVEEKEKKESQTEEEEEGGGGGGECWRLELSPELIVSVEKLKFRVVNEDGLSGCGDRRQRDGGSEYSHFIHRRNDRKAAVVPRC